MKKYVNLRKTQGNFVQALEKLNRAEPKQNLASIAKIMDERMNQSIDSDICNEGLWCPASFSEVQGRIFVTRERYNPLIPYAQKAVDVMRRGDFCLTENILLQGRPASKVLTEIAERDYKKIVFWREVLDLGQLKSHTVPTDSLADDDTISFLVQSKPRANKYGKFLRDNFGISESRVYLPELSGKDRTMGFWFYRIHIDEKSSFMGNDNALYYTKGSLLGICESD